VTTEDVTPQGPDLKSGNDVSGSNLKLVFYFTADIIDKQYRSYIWNDGKVQALVTIDGGVIAGLLVIFQIFKDIGLLAFGLLAGSFAFLLISFVVCLLHVVPRIHSGIGNQENLRTMVGITRLRKEAYHKRVTALDLGEMVRMNCWQISGMCKNNMRSHKLIKYGAVLTIAGVLTLGAAVPIIVFSAWDRRNVLTTQQQSNSLVPSRPVTGSASGVAPVPPPASRPADQAPVTTSPSATTENRPQSHRKPISGPK
jgi:hypothetical protein